MWQAHAGDTRTPGKRNLPGRSRVLSDTPLVLKLGGFSGYAEPNGLRSHLQAVFPPSAWGIAFEEATIIGLCERSILCWRKSTRAGEERGLLARVRKRLTARVETRRLAAA